MPASISWATRLAMQLDQSDLKEILSRALKERQAENPKFSMRSFSKRLGIGSAALSEILAGKRQVSSKRMDALLSRLEILSGQEVNGRVDFQLAADHFEIISSWLDFALVSYLQTKRSQDHAVMAKVFGVGILEIRTSLGRLQRLGVIRELRGKWAPAKGRLLAADHISEKALMKNHLEALQLAQRSLLENPTAMQDFVSLIFRFNPERLSELRKLVRQFLTKIEQVNEADRNAGEVYRLNFQLIPLTKKINDGGIKK